MERRRRTWRGTIVSEFRNAQVFLAQSLWWLQLEFPFRAFDILLMGDAFFGPFEGAFMVTPKLKIAILHPSIFGSPRSILITLLEPLRVGFDAATAVRSNLKEKIRKG